MSYGRDPGMDPFGGQPFGGWGQPPTYQSGVDVVKAILDKIG